MMNIIPVLLKDFYKAGHKFQYPKDTRLVYSNWTARKSRIKGINGVILFGPQYYAQEYLVNQFNAWFKLPIDKAVDPYKRIMDYCLGPGAIPVDHIADLHKLGYLPLEVKALPEGTFVPTRVPLVTLHNNIDEFFWLTNMLESMMSSVLFLPCTSATTAFFYRKRFEHYAQMTGANREFVKWQGHDFSMRGLPGLEAVCLSGAAHLLSFTGTDSIPAIPFLEEYYGANVEKELVGGSVPATEHSVMCMGMQDGELETVRRLITEVVPKGIVSAVSDTWDFFRVLTEYLPALREVVLSRDGKLVIRPDSGDPVKIVCGDPQAPEGSPQAKGALRLLYEVFGGTRNAAGYVELDPHVGLIYGDSITPAIQTEMLERMAAMGFASSNIVMGIGSFTYMYVTRDTYGFAMKATYGETARGPQNIFKKPVTDDGTKNSACGLLQVEQTDDGIVCHEQVSWEEEAKGMLQTIFLDSEVRNVQTLGQIRERIEAQL